MTIRIKGKIGKAIAIMITAILVLAFITMAFQACNRQDPEQEKWTIDVLGFHKDRNDLRVETIIREVYPKEKVLFSYPKKTIVFADLFCGYDGKMEKYPFLKDNQLAHLGQFEIRYLRFFSEYSEYKSGKPINFRMDLKIGDKLVFTGDILEIAK